VCDDSGGCIEVVIDEEIFDVYWLLVSREGVFVELVFVVGVVGLLKVYVVGGFVFG